MLMRYRTLPPASALVALEAVVRHASFAAAARELRVSQSAVSQQVKLLEARLGVELVLRRRPRIRPTAEGRTVADAVRVGLDHVADALELVRRRARPGHLVVAATTSFSSFWLMPRLPDFHAAHPEVELHLLSSDVELESSRADFDVGVVYAHEPWQGREEHRLFGDQILAVCHPDLLARVDSAEGPAGLAERVLLHHDFTDPAWMGWPEWFEALGSRGRGTSGGRHFSNYALLLQAALEGQGVAMGWRRLVEPMLARGALVRASDAVVVPKADYRVVLPAERPVQEAAYGFRDWLLSQAGADW